MGNKSRLTDLTMVDLERCFRIQTSLDRADDAITTMLGPRGIAIRELLRLAYQETIEIMKKGAPAAIRKAERGMYARKPLDQAFWDRVISLAQPLAHPAGEPDKDGGDNG